MLWLNPKLWIAIALLGLLALTHGAAYRVGSLHVKRAWDKQISLAKDQQIKAEQEARAREQELVAAKQQAEVKYVQSKKQAAVAALGAQSELDRLRNALAARDRATRQDATACPGAHAEAGPERDILGTCATELVRMAREADAIATRLTGLQQYVASVCLKQ